MANLACVGSHAINGVAELHSELLKQDVLRDFHALWPEKFSNKTNGVTPRRWLMLANPRLSRLITSWIGAGWTRDLAQLRALEPLADDADFRSSWRDVKHANKIAFARYVQQELGMTLDPDSMFDVLVKRIHEYKRQHLSILHVVALYLRLKDGRDADPVPRTFIYGGKAAPGYRMAKLIIKLINAVGAMINRDPATRDRLRVVFVPNFSVRTGQRIYPCADLSEQISTAGKEASGTGNMKFTMNGALTIGTLDGANIEIRDEVGADNFFLFGLDAAAGGALKAQGYRPAEAYRTQPQLQEVIDLIASGFFSRGDGELFRAAARQPLAPRSLPRARGLRLVPRLPAGRRRRLRGPRSLDAHVDPQRGALRQVFLGPRRARVRGTTSGAPTPFPVRLISQDDIAGNLLQ